MSEQPRRTERGAILVHVSLILFALLAVTAFAIDYGALFASRNQVQSAADAAALAAATSLTFVSLTNETWAKSNAVAAAQQNQVWGAAPDVTTADLSTRNQNGFRCPAGAPGIPDTCVRADVFRTTYNRAGGSPLPTFFANLVGVSEQGVRASATAQMRAASGTADCVKPFAIADKWTERQTPGWDAGDFFQRFTAGGALLGNPDQYTAPTTFSAGTGFRLATDYGLLLTVSAATPTQIVAAGDFFPVQLGLSFDGAITSCSSRDVRPGDFLTPDAPGVTASTQASVSALIAQDPSATWSAAAYGGLGGPVGGCMAAGTCSRSPRIIALPLFNPATYDQSRTTTTTIRVTNVIGFWIQSVSGGNITGRIMPYSTISLSGSALGNNGSAAFARTAILVR